MTPRPILRSLVLVLITMTVGLAVRLVPLGLPVFVVKYAGSMLWALAIYWIVSSVLGRSRVQNAALLAALISTCVECLKLYHSPELDAFRLTLPGMLLLGRHFSMWDVAAYWVAICAGASLDGRWLRLER